MRRGDGRENYVIICVKFIFLLRATGLAWQQGKKMRAKEVVWFSIFKNNR